MSFELLPNEILLDIFEYFNGIDLLRIFYGLNFRINFVLHNRFPNCSFEFNAVSKRDFDMICQQYLPSMAEYITTLNLFDCEESPTEIHLFLSNISSFNQFIQLQFLSLSNLRSYETLLRILEGCHHLPNLTHLNFFHCYLQENQVDFQLIINQIWSLSKLIHCTIGIATRGQYLFCTPTQLSSSIQYLSIDRIQIKLHQINQLFEYTSALQYLSISVQSFIDNDYILSPLPTLIDLSINSFITCNALNMAILLQNTPNLHRLNIDLSSELVDGHQWEEMIRTCLPILERFQFRMKITLPLGQDIQNRVEELVNSFQTPFWIDEHQRFIRCLISNRTIYLYSLSNNYDENFPVSYKSTYLYDDQKEFYEKITKIISPTFFDQIFPLNIHLTKIHDLCINLPIPDQFWSIIHNFKQLKTLQIRYHTNAFQTQVQALLNRASRLQRLSIHQYESISLQIALFKYKNVSIHELDLREMNHYFNEEECIRLSRAPLGIQCEKLSILVSNRQSIICLIENIPKLRALNI